MSRKLQIAVLGASKEICTQKEYKMAEEVGAEIAKIDAICLTGGGHGVMEAAMKGAKKYKGLTLGILPWEKIEHYNKYCDVIVATGIGFSRDAINVNSCDGAIIVGGGAGTLNEVTYAYIEDVPVVALPASGGVAKKIAGTYLDMRKTEIIHSAHDAKSAVKKLLEEIRKHKVKNKHIGISKKRVQY
jgi:uncharacterized protein (TIGR00725 family)